MRIFASMIFSHNDTKIAGRGVAMAAASTRSHCGKQGLYARKYWKKEDDNDSTSTGAHIILKNEEYSNGKAASIVGAGHKWYCVHKPASHDDTECYKQGAPRQPQSRRAHNTSAVRGASTRLVDVEKPSLNFDDGFEEMFAFTGLLAGSGNRDFHHNGGCNKGFTPTATVAATGVFTPTARQVHDDCGERRVGPLDRRGDDCKTAENHEGYRKKLKQPKAIMASGKKKVFTTATGTIWGYVIDQACKRVPLRISAMFVYMDRDATSSPPLKQCN